MTHPFITPISRRRFLALSGGLLASGCTAQSAGELGTGTTTTTSSVDGSTTTITTSTGAVVTTVAAPGELVPDDRVLVIVEMNGGNDAVNTLIPDLGSYRDLRPSIQIPEDEIIRVDALAGHGLHPSLAPLVPLFEAGRVATIAGVGFADPDRSHFTSTDRWHRADRMDNVLGWMGRWLDTLPADLPALGATALGSAGHVLDGATRRGSSIDSVDAFAFPAGLSNTDIRALAAEISDDPLIAAAQAAFNASVGAVEEFDPIADAVRASNAAAGGNSSDANGGENAVDDGYIPSSGPFSSGLAVAAELIKSDVGTRVVTVAGGGFDTHSGQLELHGELLGDLADGLAAFWASLDASGHSDRVLLITTSEFGRRVPENGSLGCDHGSASVALVMGNSVNPGLTGSIDTDNLIDDDLQPQFDPRTMFTTCLDWLGGDVEQVLGERHDEIDLLA